MLSWCLRKSEHHLAWAGSAFPAHPFGPPFSVSVLVENFNQAAKGRNQMSILTHSSSASHHKVCDSGKTAIFVCFSLAYKDGQALSQLFGTLNAVSDVPITRSSLSAFEIKKKKKNGFLFFGSTPEIIWW